MRAVLQPLMMEERSSWKFVSRDDHTSMVIMPTDDWIGLADHPRQRDTERHSRAQHWALAREAKGAAADVLRHVVAAELDGQLYKVDGHTRGYLWETGGLEKPATVFVRIHGVASVDELNSLYKTFDAQSAAETSYDQVSGAFRENKIELKSRRLRHGYLGNALWIGLRGKTKKSHNRELPPVDIYKAVAFYKKELLLLDTIDPKPEIFYTGVVAAALIGLALHPEEVEFFNRLSNRKGNMKDGANDPVQSVLKLVDDLTKAKKSWVHHQHEDLCARTLRAFQAWVNRDEDPEGYWFKSRVRAVDILPLIEEVKVQRDAMDDPYL